jgi:hypothetical protein
VTTVAALYVAAVPAGEASAAWPSVLQGLGSLVGGQPDAFLDDIKRMAGSDMEVVVPASGEGGWRPCAHYAIWQCLAMRSQPALCQ